MRQREFKVYAILNERFKKDFPKTNKDANVRNYFTKCANAISDDWLSIKVRDVENEITECESISHWCVENLAIK